MNEPKRAGTRRRSILAVIGDGGTIDPPVEALCGELGRRAVEAGFRVVTGGLGGVMEAVSRGASLAPSARDGDVIGVLPGYDRRVANPYLDIVVPTGMQIGRNVIVVAMADVVIAVGGGAGTLSEIAVAWQLGKPILALASSGGWAGRIADTSIDARRSDAVHSVETAEQAIALAIDLTSESLPEPGDINSDWRRGGA